MQRSKSSIQNNISELDLQPYDDKDQNPEQVDVQPALQRVPSSEMMAQDIKEMNDNKIFTLGFARKKILVNQFPFTHSAIAFLDTSTKDQAKWLIYGRQTPFFIKPNSEEAKHYQGGLLNLFNNLTISKIDNEKKYDFFKSQDFFVEPTNVKLSGAEIKQIIKMADDIICKTHRFDLVHSNCYSASVSMLEHTIKTISQRPESTRKDKIENDKSIMETYRLLQHASQDNFSIGVKNQSLVTTAMEEVDDIMQRRGLKAAENYDDLVAPDFVINSALKK